MTNALATTASPRGSIDRLRMELRPMGRPDMAHPSAEARALSKKLAMIGAKIAPTAGEEQGRAWRASMVIALSDLPFDIVMQAIDDAMHQPIRFFSEAEETIRRCANRHKRAVEIQIEKREQIALNSMPPPPPPPQEVLEKILDEEWPDRDRHTQTVAQAIRIPGKDEAEDYARFFKRIGITSKGE